MHCSQYYYIGDFVAACCNADLSGLALIAVDLCPDGVRHMGLDKYGGGRHMPRDSVISGTRF